MNKEKESQAYALRMAIQLGCTGAHKGPDGKWMPCRDADEMEELSNAAEDSSWYEHNTIGELRARDKKARLKGKSALIEAAKRGELRAPKKKKKKNDWDNLTEKPLPIHDGLNTLPSGGLYGMTSKGVAVPMNAPHDEDPDVFSDPEVARNRSRQLGCIGISRRVSRSGKTIWMPCTNMTDYSRLSGTTDLGRRGKRENERRAIRTIVNQELKKRKIR